VFEAAKAAGEQNRTQAFANDERERWRGTDLWRARQGATPVPPLFYHVPIYYLNAGIGI